MGSKTLWKHLYIFFYKSGPIIVNIIYSVFPTRTKDQAFVFGFCMEEKLSSSLENTSSADTEFLSDPKTKKDISKKW